jgi:hypothetical protein
MQSVQSVLINAGLQSDKIIEPRKGRKSAGLSGRILPSLRDSSLRTLQPSVKTLGYLSVVPAGQPHRNSRKALGLVVLG